MVEEEKLLKEFINKFEAKVQLKNEHDLIKINTPYLGGMVFYKKLRKTVELYHICDIIYVSRKKGEGNEKN